MTRARDEHFMRLAVEQAKAAVRDGQSPFGAVIVRSDEVVCAAHNVVLATIDATAHAEVHALRLACEKLNTIDLAGCTLYSSTEPCPMCFAAIHWAGCDRIVYGTTIQDSAAVGFGELAISNAQMKRLGGARLDITGGVLRDEALKAFALFAEIGDGRVY